MLQLLNLRQSGRFVFKSLQSCDSLQYVCSGHFKNRTFIFIFIFIQMFNEVATS